MHRGKPKNSEKNLSQCHFVHHKSHTNPGLRSERPATNDLSHDTALSHLLVLAHGHKAAISATYI
jgi:hypothetical protein